jgi:hypothetical protein
MSERPTGGLNDLEPSAMQAPVGSDIPAFCMVSIAISLKRIADAIDSESPKGSILYFLETIASAANAGRS